ncbi:beta sliding clamp-like [Ylistrum balloti]|uniref:beta sliding clamp-like n=1 Tax=Ylistrum balloti TaxID=509963 RepID=UPI002905866F|nr:beta sliding clamp-like [Ylistrum balloti]
MGCSFEVKRSTFEQALFGIQNVAQKRTATPILANVRIDASNNELHLFATDYDIGLQQRLEATVDQVGSAALPARVLYDIVKKSKGDSIRIEIDDNHQGVVKTGVRARYKLVGMNPVDFPEPSRIQPETSLKLDRDMFRLWIKKTLFAASSDESRVSLAGVFLEAYDGNNLRFVATDTHRLGLVEVQGIEGCSIVPEDGIIFPRKALQELQRICDGEGEVQVTIDTPSVQVEWDDTVFVFRTVDGRFPNYRTVIPESTSRVVVIDRQEFMQAIDRVSLVVTDRFKCVTLAFENNILTIMANNPDMGEGEEQIDCTYDGDRLEIGFNAQYIQESLSEITTDKIELRLIDDVSPTLIYGENDESYLNVIMPMRI